MLNMAKTGVNTATQCAAIIEDAKNGIFKPVYLLMGDEPFYPEMVCDAIVENCIDEFSKDFNQTICYGSEVKADSVISAARRYPMMADRQLVVVKEAQLMKDIEQLQYYVASPLDTTVLVVLLHGGSVDKRKAFYKGVQKCGGVIVDSAPVRDYELTSWILDFYRQKGLEIDPRAAQLLGEATGTDLSTIKVETDKLLRNLPEGTVKVTQEDVEKNVGVSRQYSVFELTRALSSHNAAQSVKVAMNIGSGARFAMPMAVSTLFTHFYRILKYGALSMKGPVSQDEKSRVLGVNPYFFREYDEALRWYPVPKAQMIVSMLLEYDFKGKGGDGGDMPQGELLVELIVKILNI